MAEIGHRLEKQDYKALLPELRQDLVELQQELRQADFPVIVVFAGVDGAGKSETVNQLHEWMDSRWITTRAFGEASDEERDRPNYWRFWRELPQRGRMGLYLSAWYSRPVLDRVFGRLDEAEFDAQLSRIQAFEKALADDGALILKFWMHLSKDKQKERLKALEKNPAQHWRISERDWEHWRMYDRFVGAAERTLQRTSTGEAPWHIIEGYDWRYRSVSVATTIRDAVRRHLAERASLAAHGALSAEAEGGVDAELPRQPTVLSGLATDHRLEKKSYRRELERLQGELNVLQRRARERRVSTILVFEGWDAAGKGGAIRRVTQAMDARDYQVIQIAAPTDEEAAHHYLWRFWRHLPRAGRVTIFDRSWYGRVLVERVEGYASEREWRRAYSEINHFEEQLVEHGVVLVKFWLHITADEQLRRFEARKETVYKAWKLTDEDWRNRERWDDYEHAVHDMVEKTSPHTAPWTLIEANDKRWARVRVLETVCARLRAALGPDAQNG